METDMDNLEELASSEFADIIRQMIAQSGGSPVVTEENVFQEGNPTNKPLLSKIMTELLLPGSRIDGFENLVELYRLAQRKKHCLILMEHYSNFDIPALYELLERCGEEGRKIAGSIVSVAGVKLNEESKLVLAFTEIFTRVVLFPSRSMEGIKDPKERREAEKRRAKLNIAAMKALMRLRREGRIVLVFPTGTRYRPWDPSTAKGLKEIDSYLKFYSHMVMIAINGNTLLPNRQGSMSEDFPIRDVMIYTVSPVKKCSEFRHEALKTHDQGKDHKQHVVDRVMAHLSELHEAAEKIRVPLMTSVKKG
jgi:1-acyl-sn-glycerol-3-phosphate acyltransferase